MYGLVDAKDGIFNLAGAVKIVSMTSAGQELEMPEMVSPSPGISIETAPELSFDEVSSSEEVPSISLEEVLISTSLDETNDVVSWLDIRLESRLGNIEVQLDKTISKHPKNSLW
jgi:hypothetical protein